MNDESSTQMLEEFPDLSDPVRRERLSPAAVKEYVRIARR